MGRYFIIGRERALKRGANGGETLWSGAPQLVQQSCGTSSTRSQRPRAPHCGFKHWTVQPGSCKLSSQCAKFSGTQLQNCAEKKSALP